jgi:hypothetical protein
MDELSVHLMQSVCNRINKCGSKVEFIPGGYTRYLQILVKGVNNLFKQYMREEFERWIMMNGSYRRLMQAKVVQCIAHAWSKVTRETIVNTWNDVGHKAGDQEDNEDSDTRSVVGLVGSNSGTSTN